MIGVQWRDPPIPCCSSCGRLRIAFFFGCEFEQELRTPVAAGLGRRPPVPSLPIVADVQALYGPRRCESCLALLRAVTLFDVGDEHRPTTSFSQCPVN
jgi:hypothetical protein